MPGIMQSYCIIPGIMYLKREISSAVTEASSQFPVVILTGPRQVGKTTLLQHLEDSKRSYVTLDDPILRELANRDGALFLERFVAPVLIDEIQYAPGLLQGDCE